MPNLTSTQANQLANDFLALAQAVGEYRHKNIETLNEQEYQELRNYHWSILNCSDDLFTLSANLVLEDVQSSLTQIADVTNNIKATLNNLENVQKAINIATSIVTLGAAVISKNPQAIMDSLSGLQETLVEE